MKTCFISTVFFSRFQASIPMDGTLQSVQMYMRVNKQKLIAYAVSFINAFPSLFFIFSKSTR